MRRLVIRAVWLIFGLLLTAPARIQAQNPVHGPTPGETSQRLANLEAEVARLRGLTGFGAAPVQAAMAEAPYLQTSDCCQSCGYQDPAGAACLPHCSRCGGRLLSGAAAKPKSPTVTVTGFFQADAAWSTQSPNNILSVGDVQDGADFRRARLAAKGNLATNMDYMVEFDFAFPGRPSFMDVYTTIKDLPVVGNFRVGQWRQPFSLDAMTSVRELPFLERALPFAFNPFRQIGIGIFDQTSDTRGTWAASLFRYPTDVFGGNVGDDGGYSMATRITRLVWDEEKAGSLLHLGGGYSYINPSNNATRFLSQPELFIAEVPGTLQPPLGPEAIPPFVDTRFIDTSNLQLLNAELAGVWGALHGQAEVTYARVDQIGGPSLTFSGAYGQLGYYLTGEQREYNRSAGCLGRITPYAPFQPGCGWGAWETVVRLSTLDLTNNNIRGGTLTDFTWGLNWYLNRFAKFQLNYIHPFLDNPLRGHSNADFIAVRCQADF